MAPESLTESKEESASESTSARGKPTWVTMKARDLETIVVTLAKEGKTPAQIGLILRDTHGVPKSKLVGKKITHILKEHGITFETDTHRVVKKMEKAKAHLAKHSHDYPASRAMTKRLWAIHRFEKKRTA